MENEDLFTDYKVLFHKDFDKNNKNSQLLRSVFKFGSPINVDGQIKAKPDEEKKDFEKK